MFSAKVFFRRHSKISVIECKCNSPSQSHHNAVMQFASSRFHLVWCRVNQTKIEYNHMNYWKLQTSFGVLPSPSKRYIHEKQKKKEKRNSETKRDNRKTKSDVIVSEFDRSNRSFCVTAHSTHRAIAIWSFFLVFQPHLFRFELITYKRNKYVSRFID